MTLEITDLTCDRGGRRILAGLTLTAAPGEVVVLRGPNGAGKSTLLRAAAGLLPVSAGRIAAGEAVLAQDRDAYLDRIAYAGHLDAIKPQLTVRENLGFWASLFGGSADRAMEAFALEDIADRPAAYCSAGQKRRLGLARLLVAPRPIWLLDEPTVSLDRAMGARFDALVDQHCAAGGLAVIATHIDLGLDRARIYDMPEPRQAGPEQAILDPFLYETDG